MLKWEFLEVLCLSDQVYVVPSGKIDLRWVTQKCPQSKIQWVRDCLLDKVSFPSMRDAREYYSAVLDYAGSQGWRPLASGQAHSQSVSFMRSSPAG
jgi:hypothetical protein